MKLYTLNLQRLHNDESSQFIIRLLSDVEELNIDTAFDARIKAYWIDLKANAATFKEAIKQIAAQKETLELAELDRLRDQCIITLRRQVEVYEFATTDERKDAYAAATIIMNNWKKLEYANYEAETIGIDKLLSTWNLPEQRIYVEALNLREHLDELEKAADIFNKLFGNRSVAAASKIVYDVKALRNTTEANYKSMAEYVLVMAKNDTENKNYAKLLDAINNVRHYFADVVARRNGDGKNEG